jgi:hypothetical protein
VDMARRGWIAARDVANTGSRDELLAWAAGKPQRIKGGAGVPTLSGALS